MVEIDLEEYCEQVSSLCNQMEANIVPEQILEAIGGIANLYLKFLLSERKAEYIFHSYEAFASEHVQVDEILQEIENCAGTNEKRSKLILYAMKKRLLIYFKNNDGPLLFPPLGRFEAMDWVSSSYVVICRDPAARDYQKFLIGRHNQGFLTR